MFKSKIMPTGHYQEFHCDVEWDLVIETLMCPTKSRPNRRRGDDRFTYIKRFRKFVIEVHVKKDADGNIWVINAFKMWR